MLRRALPVALVLAAVAADGAGFHLVAFYLLVAGVPAAAAAALTVLGELVMLSGRSGVAAARVQALLSALGLAAIVLAAAARANSVDGGSLPPLAASALIACLGTFALQGFVALLAASPPKRVWRRLSEGELRGRVLGEVD